jgi:hypothetical protein
MNQATKDKISQSLTKFRQEARKTKTACKNGHLLKECGVNKRGQCKKCLSLKSLRWQDKYRKKDPEGYNARICQWRKNNRVKSLDIQRRHLLKKKYGLTPEQVDQVFQAQGKKCGNPGCSATTPGTRNKTWCVDHNHLTGEFRGVLCNGCNAALGFLHDDEARILGLIGYLKQNSAVN